MVRNRAARKSSKRKRERKTHGCLALYLSYFFTLALIASFFIFANLYNSGVLTINYFEADSTIALSLLFPSVVFTYMLTKRMSLREILSSLGLSADRLSVRAVIVGVSLFAAILLLQVAFSIFQSVTNIPLPTNVGMLLNGMPLYLLIFAVVVAPIDEEILFRGFLVPRIGIILSALVFSLFHLSYLSISEFLAAFIFGLIAGYAFKRTKSLYATIIGHALVNLLTILVLLL